MARTGLDIVNEMISGWRAEARPVARILATSTGEYPPPFFLVIDTGAIRDQFIHDTVQMLFGRQSNGELHTWERTGRGRPPS